MAWSTEEQTEALGRGQSVVINYPDAEPAQSRWLDLGIQPIFKKLGNFLSQACLGTTREKGAVQGRRWLSGGCDGNPLTLGKKEMVGPVGFGVLALAEEGDFPLSLR